VSRPSAAELHHARHPRKPVGVLRHERERGSAVVDFVLIGALTTILFAAVIQLTLVLHVRSTLVDCVAEGARYGALADRTPDDGARRARELIRMSLHPSFAEQVTAVVVVRDGVEVVEVTATARLPLVGLLGPSGSLTVDGHALREPG
jgi:hypothetical protein